jgi:hypothetical protein
MHLVTSPSPGRGPRALIPVLAGLWTIALVPVGLFLGLLTVFGVTPTECSAPASAYCTQGWLAPLTVGVVLVGWLLAVALSLSAALRRRGGHLVLSVVALAATVMALLAALAAWTR